MAEPWVEEAAKEIYCDEGDRWSNPNGIAEVIERHHAPCALSARCAAERVVALEAEVARLKRGDFTPDEFQGLCHHRDEKPDCTRADFEAGCREYQSRLFGASERTAPTTQPLPTKSSGAS